MSRASSYGQLRTALGATAIGARYQNYEFWALWLGPKFRPPPHRTGSALSMRPAPTLAARRVCSVTDKGCILFLISRSLARAQSLRVRQANRKRPALARSQICEKPGKLNASGLPAPPLVRSTTAGRPNSMRRVLSRCPARKIYCTPRRRHSDPRLVYGVAMLTWGNCGRCQSHRLQ